MCNISRIRGTPTEEVWPDFANMPYFADWFPNFPGKCLENVVANLPEHACEFLEVQNRTICRIILL